VISPVVMVRVLLAMTATVHEKNARIAQLEEEVAALEQTLTDTELRATRAEIRLVAWEAAVGAVGPFGRPV
jgi:outer membrane murein-binding lipoprotein Lpp